MSYQIFNEASLGKFIELIQNKVRSIVDNANVASATNATNATKATQDSDGNAINTTYRKISDSYSKSEVDAKVGKSSSSITITTDDLIANYTFPQLMTLLKNGTTVYLKLTDKDVINGSNYLSGEILALNSYRDLDDNKFVEWSTQFYEDGVLFTIIVTSELHADDLAHNATAITLSYTAVPTNTVTLVSTIDIAVSAWNSASKTAEVSVSVVTADNAVDVAPAEVSYDDYVNAGIRATAQSNGKLTFMCKTIPTKTISVNIKAILTQVPTDVRFE